MELICNVHDEVISKLTNIEKYENGAIRALRDAKYYSEERETIDEMDTAISEIEKAKVMGQHMEDRLSIYHDTIESLGFKR